LKTARAARPCRFDSCRFRHLRTVGREVRHRHAKPANPQGCGGSIPPPSAIRARSPIGRRRRPEMADSAGSNPAVLTNATVAQLVGGSGFKPRAVSVRIGPVAPRWRNPIGRGGGPKPRTVSVRVGPPARVPFRSAGCNPADYETERRASRGSTPRGPTITTTVSGLHPPNVYPQPTATPSALRVPSTPLRNPSWHVRPVAFELVFEGPRQRGLLIRHHEHKRRSVGRATAYRLRSADHEGWALLTLTSAREVRPRRRLRCRETPGIALVKSGRRPVEPLNRRRLLF
jgi:hypothetical protein